MTCQGVTILETSLGGGYRKITHKVTLTKRVTRTHFRLCRHSKAVTWSLISSHVPFLVRTPFSASFGLRSICNTYRLQLDSTSSLDDTR